MTDIILGFEKGSGAEVRTPLHHTVITGITRSGKTTALKALMDRAPKDLRFLVFDTKTPSDFEGFGAEVPIYIQEKADPDTLKQLMESQAKYKLKWEFTELLKVYKEVVGEPTWEGILEVASKWLLEEKRHPVELDKLRVLEHYLGKLVKKLSKIRLADSVELPGRVNVVPLSGLDLDIQQLCVASTLDHVLREESDLVVVIDEFHRQAPLAASSASKEAVATLAREGAAKNIYLYASDQSITGVDKVPLKQMWVWILGKQTELNEAKRTYDQIPRKDGIKVADVMMLGVGFFILSTEEGLKQIYIWPDWMERPDAVDIAKGEALMSEKEIKHLEKKEGVLFPHVELAEYKALKEAKDELEGLVTQYERRVEDIDKEIAAKNREIQRLEGELEVTEPLRQFILNTVRTEFKPEELASTESVKEAYQMWIDKLPTTPSKILAFMVEKHPMRFTRGQLARLTGYAARGGAYNGALSTLKRNGLIELSEDGYLRLTEL